MQFTVFRIPSWWTVMCLLSITRSVCHCLGCFVGCLVASLILGEIHVWFSLRIKWFHTHVDTVIIESQSEAGCCWIILNSVILLETLLVAQFLSAFYRLVSTRLLIFLGFLLLDFAVSISWYIFELLPLVEVTVILCCTSCSLWSRKLLPKACYVALG